MTRPRLSTAWHDLAEVAVRMRDRAERRLARAGLDRADAADRADRRDAWKEIAADWLHWRDYRLRDEPTGPRLSGTLSRRRALAEALADARRASDADPSNTEANRWVDLLDALAWQEATGMARSCIAATLAARAARNAADRKAA